MAKACCLPFIQSNEFCTKPFGIIHCDLWGPSPATSFQRFRLYVIFIDECTRYTWFYQPRDSIPHSVHIHTGEEWIG